MPTRRQGTPGAKRLRLPGNDGYEVGRGKPPIGSRFGPGKSGNPRGRPLGAKNKVPALNEERLKSIVLEEAYRTITVTDGGKSITISVAQAIVRSLALSAAKGNARSQRLFTELLDTTERSHKALYDKYLESLMEYKCHWDRELQRRRQLGIVAPDPVPHPNHIIIDLDAGTAEIRGPRTDEEKALHDKFVARKDECDEQIANLQASLEIETAPAKRRRLHKEIRRELRVRELIRKIVSDWTRQNL